MRYFLQRRAGDRQASPHSPRRNDFGRGICDILSSSARQRQQQRASATVHVVSVIAARTAAPNALG